MATSGAMAVTNTPCTSGTLENSDEEDVRSVEQVREMAKKSSKKADKRTKHGTRAYQKDEGGPSWNTGGKPPDTEAIMEIIERKEEDLELYRRFLAAISADPTMQSLSMIEMIDIAEMCMLQEKIGNWLLGIDDPDRLEKMKESNKMLRAIWQIKSKMMNDARERSPIGGTFEGISKVLDEQEEEEDEGTDE